MENTDDTLSDQGIDSDHPLSISSTTGNYTENEDPNTPDEQSSWDIAPPPENQYDNAELADKATHTWTQENKFELVRKKAFKRKGDRTIYGYLYKYCMASRERHSIPESKLLPNANDSSDPANLQVVV
ncbi:hypothetical protein MMC22_000342 [Lobaria immixta]|nr:hypothetical protein [Lobaria immixta]